MSTENEITYETDAPVDERRYSSFVPQVIVMAAIILWSGYQCYIALSQKSALDNEFKTAQPLITASQTAQSRLYALAQDVNQTAAHDNYAAQIVKEFNIQLTANANRNGAAPDH
jgi:hypothetical protein